mgnify:CR=1 FL=1
MVAHTVITTCLFLHGEAKHHTAIAKRKDARSYPQHLSLFLHGTLYVFSRSYVIFYTKACRFLHGKLSIFTL